jgi:hypothetical protein
METKTKNFKKASKMILPGLTPVVLASHIKKEGYPQITTTRQHKSGKAGHHPTSST